jgi:hypothetical protein
MGLKPSDKKISQIFNNIQYDVDFYQREYKWTDEGDKDYKPISSLLKDIFYRFVEKRLHYFCFLLHQKTHILSFTCAYCVSGNFISVEVEKNQKKNNLMLLLFHLNERYYIWLYF